MDIDVILLVHCTKRDSSSDEDLDGGSVVVYIVNA